MLVPVPYQLTNNDAMARFYVCKSVVYVFRARTRSTMEATKLTILCFGMEFNYRY